MKQKIIPPGATIGILGGGQLGRMLALAARNMGYRIQVLDPDPACPCAQVADRHIQGTYDDVGAGRELASTSDVLTYEFENISSRMAASLEGDGYLPQGSRLLFLSQHRLREKQALQEAGVPVAPYRAVTSLEELRTAAGELGLPAVLKTATGGYDGKGQFVLHKEEEIPAAWDQLSAMDKELVLEQWIPFRREISVVICRGTNGEMVSFPPAENIHQQNILRFSLVPAREPDQVLREAQQIAMRIASHLEVVGLLGVEMFVSQEGQVLVNELAPRPHNSGHYTMNACATSQFEQHIRAICGLPLGDSTLLTAVVMVNLLGEEAQRVVEHIHLLPGDAHLHLYGKKEARPQRKMGHINWLAADVPTALENIQAYAQQIGWPLLIQ